MLTSSGSTGGRGGDAKTIISPNASFGDIMTIYLRKWCKVQKGHNVDL